jgi:hypothetical protein
MLKLIGTTSLTCLFASLAFAESSGSISGEIDGRPVSWQLNAGQSDWNDFGVSLMGRYPEGVDGFGSVMIGFQKNGREFEAPELRLFAGSELYGGKDADGVRVRIDHWETTGETLTLKGAVAGPVYHVRDLVARTYDTSDAHTLDLAFDLVITNE